MTAIIVAVQGTGITDRTKTCVRASAKAKARAFERRRTISYRGAAGRAASIQNRRSPACDLDVRDGDSSAPIYASLVKGEGDASFTLIWSLRNGD